MKIEIIKSLEQAHKATGLAVVIDVFRAFTLEAYIFANGAKEIIPVKNLEEAYTLKKENPGYLLVGERNGLKPEGFDFGNSPTEILTTEFTGKTVVHTTSNGTKGLMNASRAQHVLVGSFVIATSIVEYIKRQDAEDIYLIATAPDTEEDNEDVLLAYYLRDLLHGNEVDENSIKDTLITTSAHNFLLNEVGVPKTDFDLCLNFNRFSFVIKKVQKDDQMYLIKEIM